MACDAASLTTPSTAGDRRRSGRSRCAARPQQLGAGALAQHLGASLPSPGKASATPLTKLNHGSGLAEIITFDER